MGQTKAILENETHESSRLDAEYAEYMSGSLEEPKTETETGTLIDFGIYKNSHTYDWVYEHDYPYFMWIVKSVRKVHPKLKKVLKPNGLKIVGTKKLGYKLTAI